MKQPQSTSPRLELVERPCPTCGAAPGDAGRVVARGYDFEYDSCSNELTFLRCGRCATVYLSPSPSREDFDTIYPESYYTVAEASGRGGAGRIVTRAWRAVEKRRALPFVELLGDGPKRVLDIGCGDGRLLRVLRSLSRGRWRLVGVEQGLPDESIEAAARGGITLHRGWYEDLDLGRERFDLIVAQQVIEHTLEPGAVLRKARSELTPGGHLVLDTPSYESLDRRLFTDSYWGGYHFPRHMTLFTPETISELARRTGFEVVSVEALLSPVFWIMTLHNVGVGAGLPRWVTSRITYRSVPLLVLATLIEVPNLTVLKRTSNMRVVLRKPRSARRP